MLSGKMPGSVNEVGLHIERKLLKGFEQGDVTLSCILRRRKGCWERQGEQLFQCPGKASIRARTGAGKNRGNGRGKGNANKCFPFKPGESL